MILNSSNLVFSNVNFSYSLHSDSNVPLSFVGDSISTYPSIESIKSQTSTSSNPCLQRNVFKSETFSTFSEISLPILPKSYSRACHTSVKVMNQSPGLILNIRSTVDLYLWISLPMSAKIYIASAYYSASRSELSVASIVHFFWRGILGTSPPPGSGIFKIFKSCLGFILV